jgi:hypothetical protein
VDSYVAYSCFGKLSDLCTHQTEKQEILCASISTLIKQIKHKHLFFGVALQRMPGIASIQYLNFCKVYTPLENRENPGN